MSFYKVKGKINFVFALATLCTRENKQCRFYWKINLVERNYGDEVSAWIFKDLRKFILVDLKNRFLQILLKFIFCKNMLLHVTSLKQILSCKFVFIWNTNFLRRFNFCILIIPFMSFNACSYFSPKVWTDVWKIILTIWLLAKRS